MNEEREKYITDLQTKYFGSKYAGIRIEKLLKAEAWSEWQEQALKKIKNQKILEMGSLYLFSKQNRIGKTYMQAALFAEVRRVKKATKVFSDVELEKYLTKNYFDNSWEYLKQEIYKTDFFFFKDFGKIAESREFSMPLLFEFFDIIVSNEKRMIFCSNYLPKEIASFDNKNWTAIASRIHEEVSYL